MAFPNATPTAIICTQIGALDAAGNPLTTADGDEFVMLIPNQGDAQSSSYTRLVDAETRTAEGNCFTQITPEKITGHTISETFCAQINLALWTLSGAKVPIYDTAVGSDTGCIVGVMEPNAGEDECNPCAILADEAAGLYSMQHCCVGCKDNNTPPPLHPVSGLPLYWVQIASFDKFRPTGAFNKSANLANNRQTWTANAFENETLYQRLIDEGILGEQFDALGNPYVPSNGILEFYTDVPPACALDACGSCDGGYITAAGIAAGTDPVPVFG